MKQYNVTVSFKVGVDANGNRSGGMPIAETVIEAADQTSANRQADAWLAGQSEHVRNVARAETFCVTPRFSGFSAEEVAKITAQ
jgi:hypothetical protein